MTGAIFHEPDVDHQATVSAAASAFLEAIRATPHFHAINAGFPQDRQDLCALNSAIGGVLILAGGLKVSGYDACDAIGTALGSWLAQIDGWPVGGRAIIQGMEAGASAILAPTESGPLSRRPPAGEA